MFSLGRYRKIPFANVIIFKLIIQDRYKTCVSCIQAFIIVGKALFARPDYRRTRCDKTIIQSNSPDATERADHHAQHTIFCL